MIRRPPRSTPLYSSAASDVYKRQLLERLRPSEVSVELVVGVLTDAARVEDDDVGLLQVGRRLHPVGHQEAGDALGIVLVHLAAEGADVESARLGHRPTSVRGGG